MTDIEKIIDTPAPKVEVVTDTAEDIITSEQNEDEARRAFAATQAARKADASVSAADGSSNNVAGG